VAESIDKIDDEREYHKSLPHDFVRLVNSISSGDDYRLHPLSLVTTLEQQQQQ